MLVPSPRSGPPTGPCWDHVAFSSRVTRPWVTEPKQSDPLPRASQPSPLAEISLLSPQRRSP